MSVPVSSFYFDMCFSLSVLLFWCMAVSSGFYFDKIKKWYIDHFVLYQAFILTSSLMFMMQLYKFINCCTSHNALLCLLQAVDAASLLRLYLNFDLLDAAAELVLEYVDALLGKGHQYFGIEVRQREEHKHRRPTASRRSDESVSLEVSTQQVQIWNSC